MNYGVALYQEKITWPIWLWAFALFMAATLDLAIWAALSIEITIISGIVLFALIIYSSIASTLWVTVTKGWLIVGPAAIERAYIHNFKTLIGSELRSSRGINSDPAAYLEIRFWCKDGLRADIRDPKDKTPYWLISTNRANELIKVLDLADH
jgi:hypothetical protein